MTFCRYCGLPIPEDSLFCPKCGKRLGVRVNPRVEKITQTLKLKTPYPYAVLLIALFILWTVWPRGTSADYSHLKFNFELQKKVNNPAEHMYLQAFSIVIENTGTTAVTDLPIELRARIEPRKKADVEAEFIGRRLLILQQGQTLPLTVVVGGTIAPGAKSRVPLNGNIQTDPPFKVTYEIRDEDGRNVLANYVVEEQ
jgi:RNA polymerase subunit RPABC4/transcription elongation factor Spt4